MAMRLPALLVAVALAGAPETAHRAEPPSVAPIWAPTTGLICIWGIEATLLEVGRRCGGPRNIAFDAALADSVSRIEDYARRQSPREAAFMADYRAHQIEHDAEICNADALGMYRDMSTVPAETLRAETDRLLASSPRVEWGACL